MIYSSCDTGYPDYISDGGNPELQSGLYYLLTPYIIGNTWK